MGSAAVTHHFPRLGDLIAALLLGAAPANKERAIELVEAGNAAFDASDWTGAIDAYRSALELYPSPRILVNLAEAQRQLGHWGEALANFQRFLDRGGAAPGSRIHQSISARIREIHDRSARLVLISAEGSWPEVLLDQVRLDGEPGAPISVSPGRHQLVVRAPDGRPSTALMVTIEPGATLRLPIEAPRLARAAPPEVVPA